MVERAGVSPCQPSRVTRPRARGRVRARTYGDEDMKVDLREIYGGPTRAAAEAAIDVFADKYGAKYDKAVACLTKDREALLAFFDFPPSTGTICVHQTLSRVCSRRCVIAPCGQRARYRQRPPNLWCLNLSTPPRKHGGD